MFPTDENRALGDVQLASNHLSSSMSSASIEAAGNLLTKALNRLREGDDERAVAFVRRALALPFDEYEEAEPAPWSAHMMLFMSLSDDLENSEEGDLGWLDRLDDLVGTSGPYAVQEIRACARAFLQDFYQLSNLEKKVIRELTEGVPFDADPLLGVPPDETSRTAAIIEILTAYDRHRQMADDPDEFI